MKIFLTGLPGSGKSAAGRIAAKDLDHIFFDLDREIESRYSKTVSELFNQEGESRFRDLETIVLKDLMESKESFLIALGGGTICYNNNLELIKATNGILIYLKTNPESLVKRVHKPENLNKRPMFSGMDEEAIKTKIFQIHESRRSYYETADFTVNADQPIAEVASEICEVIRRKIQL
jgi:shikimate kinase